MPYSGKRLLESSGLGPCLQAARERAGRSQADLATALGMDPSSISHIELGSDLRTSTLFRIAAELDLEVVIVTRDALPHVNGVIEDMRTARSTL